MSDLVCARDGRPIADQAYLCSRCTDELRAALEALRAHAGDLQLTLTRQARLGAPTGARRSGERPLPFDAGASEAAWVVLNTTSTWARHVAQTRGLVMPVATVAATARLLARNLAWLRHQREAPEAVEELTAVARLVVRVIDRPPASVFAGLCSIDGERLYAREGARTTLCPGCGTVHDVAARQGETLTAAVDVLAHAALLAAAVTRLAAPVTADQVKGWARRGRILAHASDPRGRPLYRVGDVLDLLREGATTRRGKVSV